MELAKDRKTFFQPTLYQEVFTLRKLKNTSTNNLFQKNRSF